MAYLTTARPAADAPTSGVAQTLADALRPFVGGDLPVLLHAWDGSVAGQGPVVRLNSPQALTRLLWAPGELGAFMRAEHEKWGKVVKDTGATIN